MQGLISVLALWRFSDHCGIVMKMRVDQSAIISKGRGTGKLTALFLWMTTQRAILKTITKFGKIEHNIHQINAYGGMIYSKANVNSFIERKVGN